MIPAGWRSWAVANWFTLGILGVALLAWQLPGLGSSSGLLHLGAVKKPLVALLFVISGLLLPGRELLVALGRWRAHLTIQGFSFIIIPLVALALDQVWALLGVASTTRQGLLLLACLPTTVASGVGFARMAGGNDALALCNATLGNLLGIFLTPLLLVGVMGRAANAPVETVLVELGLLVLLPLILGQVLRQLFLAAITRQRWWWSQANSVALLLLILEVLSDSVVAGHGVVTVGTLAVAETLVLLFHGLLLVLAFAWSGVWGFARPDRATIVISSTQKTVALGVPLMGILYHGDPALPVLILPLVLYHATQILVASLVAPPLARWVARG